MDELSTGSQSRVTSVLAFALAAYALYWAVAYVETHLYRISFLLLALLITFLCRPSATARPKGPALRAKAEAVQKDGPTIAINAALILLSLVALLWPLVDLDAFVHRAATPTTTDVVLGIVTIGLVLEATRRTSGGCSRSPRSCFSPTATTVRCSIASASI